MNKLVFIASLVSLLVASSIQAESKTLVKGLNYCQVSKSAINNYEPEVFNTTNNLLRRTGQSELFCGEAILIYGRVVDQNCAPVHNAEIYIWQANCKGMYPYKPLKTGVVDKALISNKPDSTFVGNGRAVTNNRGEFYFITIYPPLMHRMPPHINSRVMLSRYNYLQTTFTLKNHKMKLPQYDTELSESARDLAKKGVKVYKFEVVIPDNSNKN